MYSKKDLRYILSAQRIIEEAREDIGRFSKTFGNCIRNLPEGHLLAIVCDHEEDKPCTDVEEHGKILVENGVAVVEVGRFRPRLDEPEAIPDHLVGPVLKALVEVLNKLSHAFHLAGDTANLLIRIGRDGL